MRTRNIKNNVYLNEDEKKMLEGKSNSKYTENIISHSDTQNILNEPSQISTNLSQLAKHLH